MKLRYMLALLAMVLASAAQAELVRKFAPVFVDDAEPSIFFLYGEIDVRTALNFDRAVDMFGPPKLLILSSSGGLVSQALLVAKRVNALGASTLVADGDKCFSACALVFLAGQLRVADGDLGVHQISSPTGNLQSGQLTISDILDVLGDFNVPNDLIVDMFRTPPDQIHVLSRDEKLRYGMLLRDKSARDADGSESLESRAVRFMVEFNALWSRENDVAVMRLVGLFSQTVAFYGKTVSRADILSEKRNFAERWPLRQYAVVPGTVFASCAADLCTVSANVEWDARSPARGAVSRGLAFHQLTLRLRGGTFVVIGEDGRVLKRH